MGKLYFLFITLFIQSFSQIKQNPIFLAESICPFVLSTNDNYYYVITMGKNLKIKKESGNIEGISDNDLISEDYIFISDDSYNSLINYSNKYFLIIYDPFISYEEFATDQNSIYRDLETAGFISKYDSNDIIIYGFYQNDNLVFSTYLGPYAILQINNIKNYKIICTFIQNEDYTCGIIMDNTLTIYCLKYHINPSNSQENTLEVYTNNDTNTLRVESTSSFGLYDVYKDINNIKIVCWKSNENIYCKFYEITINGQISNYELLGDDNLVFSNSNDFTERNCYFSIFNSEYLLCCAITNYIQCYRINTISYNMIKGFKISISGENSYLTIKTNSNYITLFYMNKINNKESVYEYYIYIPECNNKNYEIFNSLNENKPDEQKEKLSNLFTVKTNKYYFEIKNNPDEFGYFTLNDNRITERTLIDNNDYILDFIVIKNDILGDATKTISYIVSVEDEEAYSKKCQIIFTFKGSNNNNNNNNNTPINSPETFNSGTTLTQLKEIISNDISSYIDSSNVINGTNFLAMVLSSDNINPEEQLKNGISAIDLGNCINTIKAQNHIEKDENLIY